MRKHELGRDYELTANRRVSSLLKYNTAAILSKTLVFASLQAILSQKQRRERGELAYFDLPRIMGKSPYTLKSNLILLLLVPECSPKVLMLKLGPQSTVRLEVYGEFLKWVAPLPVTRHVPLKGNTGP